MNRFPALGCKSPGVTPAANKAGAPGADRAGGSNLGGGGTPPSKNNLDGRRACCRRAVISLFAMAWSLLAWSGCMTASKARPPAPAVATPRVAPPIASGGQPARPAPIPQAPAMPKPPAPAPAVPAAEVPAVGPEAGVTKLTMLVESEPAGATIVVDGRPVGKTPLQLGVPATVLGFFREYVEIRARFIAENETEVSQTATEEFSPREKVPAVLYFTPAGARRTVR